MDFGHKFLSTEPDPCRYENFKWPIKVYEKQVGGSWHLNKTLRPCKDVLNAFDSLVPWQWSPWEPPPLPPDPTALQHPAYALTARDTKTVTGGRAHHSLPLPCSEPKYTLSTQTRAPRRMLHSCLLQSHWTGRCTATLDRGQDTPSAICWTLRGKVATSLGCLAVKVRAEFIVAACLHPLSSKSSAALAVHPHQCLERSHGAGC